MLPPARAGPPSSRGDTSRPADRGIAIARLDGSRARRVTTGIAGSGAYDTAATWSPDGARRCFAVRRSQLHGFLGLNVS